MNKKMTNGACKICKLLGETEVTRDHGLSHPSHLSSLHQLNHRNSSGINCNPNSGINYVNHGLLNGLYLPQLKDMMLAAYLLRGYYQPAGPLIQHPPTLPPIKGPPPEPTPTPPQNSEGSDDLVATSTTSGGTNSTGNSWRSYRKTESRIASSAIPPSTSIVPTGGGFYRAYCPQYYGTPPQYQELCYPPTYPHPHPPYYKYAPAYRRQYYGYPEAGGGGPVAGGAGAGAPPGIVEYPPPLPPGEYPIPSYYGGYPPPPLPPPPPPNSAYLHPQGRPIVDHAAFQGCPCPMQSCPKNVDTGPLIGNGKGAPVASGPGLSLPPSALVGPPSPARGLAGLAPPHGANAWDTDRVQLNNNRNVNKNQQLPTSVAQHNNIVIEHCRSQINECRTKDEETYTDDKMSKCLCQKRVCASTCEVKLETLSPNDSRQLPCTNLTRENLRELKLENNNVKCESCSVSINDNISCAANCNVKCETTDFKCEIIKCEQCMKEGQMAILEIDKESGMLLIDDKLEAENGVKEEINDVVVVDSQKWIKPDYEATVTEAIEENDNDKNGLTIIVDELAKCQRVGKRKLSLDSLASSPKKRKVSKRTLSVGSSLENSDDDRVPNPMNGEYFNDKNEVDGDVNLNLTRKKYQFKKENNKRKINDVNLSVSNAKKFKSTTKHTITNGIINCLKSATTDTSIMETINDVIEQSVQMTNKKDINCKPETEKIKKQKKKTISLLSIIKKVPKTLVKVMINEKLCISKNEMKNIKESKSYKNELKNNKFKILESNKCKNKVKAKIIEIKSKVFDSKVKGADIKMKEITKENDITSKNKLNVDEKYGDIKKAALVKKKRKSTKKVTGKRSCGRIDDNIIVNENCSFTKKPFLKPKWSNGWSWEGEPYEAKVYLTNEACAIRRCYESMRHISGDVLRPRDCVLLKSGPRKADLPFVAKIAALWENPDDGEMMFSLLWYYRPEHTEQGRTDYDTEDEVFASRHRDANSVACIEDKCYILTFNEYCRYRKNLRRTEEGLDCPGLIVPPGGKNYPRESRQPPIPVPSDIVLFCRRVYDYRGKKLVKNPG